MEETSSGKSAGTNDEAARSSMPTTDMVTLETVVNVLIRKGLISEEELFAEERNRRMHIAEVGDALPVDIPKNDDDDKKAWLRRKMSKRRWTRRLGTRLFGWKWRKVKVKTDKEVLRIDANMQWKKKIDEE